MRHHVVVLDRLAALCVAVGMIMGASGAFTLAFQASGLGYTAQSVLALVLGSMLVVGGFALTNRARVVEAHVLATRPTRRSRVRATEGWAGTSRGPEPLAMRALPAPRRSIPPRR